MVVDIDKLDRSCDMLLMASTCLEALGKVGDELEGLDNALIQLSMIICGESERIRSVARQMDAGQ